MANCPATLRSARRVETTDTAMHSRTTQRSVPAPSSELAPEPESPAEDTSLDHEPAPETPRAARTLAVPSRTPFRRLSSIELVPAASTRDHARQLGFVLLVLSTLGLLLAGTCAALGREMPPGAWASILFGSTLGLILRRPTLVSSPALDGDVPPSLSVTRLAGLTILPALTLIALHSGLRPAARERGSTGLLVLVALLSAEVLQSFARRAGPSR